MLLFHLIFPLMSLPAFTGAFFLEKLLHLSFGFYFFNYLFYLFTFFSFFI